MFNEIPKNLTPEDYHFIHSYLYLNESDDVLNQSDSIGFLESTQHKIGQISKRITAEIRALFTYGSSRSTIAQTLQTRVYEKLQSFIETASVLNKNDPVGSFIKGSKAVDPHFRFNYGLELFAANLEMYENLEAWRTEIASLFQGKNENIMGLLKKCENEVGNNSVYALHCFTGGLKEVQSLTELEQLEQDFQKYQSNLPEEQSNIVKSMLKAHFDIQRNVLTRIEESKQQKNEPVESKKIVEEKIEVSEQPSETVLSQDNKSGSEESINIKNKIQEAVETSTPLSSSSVTSVFKETISTPDQPIKTESAPEEPFEYTKKSKRYPPRKTVVEPEFKPEPISQKAVEEQVTDEQLEQFQMFLDYDMSSLIEDSIKTTPSLVNMALASGMLPLHYAIHNSPPEVIDLLLPKTDLQLKDAHGFDAFDHAVQMENSELAKKIMHLNMEKDWTAVKNSWEKAQTVKEENPNKQMLVSTAEKIAEQYLEKQDYYKNNVYQLEKLKNTVQELRKAVREAQNKKDDKNSETLAAIHDELIDEIEILEKEIEKIKTIFTENFASNYVKLNEEHGFQIGYRGHNSLLVYAIGQYDVDTFLRAVKDGADISTLDETTGENLLHLAIKAGQPQIVDYLLNVNPQMIKQENVDGVTPLQLAKDIKNKALEELILARIDPEHASPEMKEKMELLQKTNQDYIDAYEKLKTTLPENQKKQIDNVAKYGILSHPEGSQGHNQFALLSVVKGDLETLVFLKSMGADLSTISIPVEKAIEDISDPLVKGSIAFRAASKEIGSIYQELKDSVFGADPSVLFRTTGPGKTLLDLAVYYAETGNEKEEKYLDTIAYLLSLKKDDNENSPYLYDPFRVNDEGESAFTMALIKGNLKAATMMLERDDISQENIPGIDKTDLDRTFQLLRVGSKLRDPVNVSSSASVQGFFSAAYLLTNLYAGNGLLSFINFVPILLSGFGAEAGGTAFREKLVQKKEQIYYPEVLKSAFPLLHKASILEFAALPQAPVASFAMTALGLYSSGSEALSSMRKAADHLHLRPLNTVHKIVMETLPVASSAARLKNMFTYLFYPEQYPKKKDKPFCKEIDIEKYQNMTALERLRDPDLNAACEKHAQLMIPNFNETHFNKLKWIEKQKYINKAVNPIRLVVHPDKRGDPAEFSKLSKAVETVLGERETEVYQIASGFAAKSEESTLSSATKFLQNHHEAVFATAAKAGIVWGAKTSYFQMNTPRLSKWMWPVIGAGSTIVRIGQGLYRLVSG